MNEKIVSPSETLALVGIDKMIYNNPPICPTSERGDIIGVYHYTNGINWTSGPLHINTSYTFYNPPLENFSYDESGGQSLASWFDALLLVLNHGFMGVYQL